MSVRATGQAAFWRAEAGGEVQEIAPIPAAMDGTTREEWLGGVHPDGQLEVTSGFHLHADKFSRVLTYLAHERRSEGSLYEQLKHATGMSHSQVKAFVQYGVQTALWASRSLRVTPLGHLMDEYDPFFDRPGTLWLLHYLFASNPLLVVWNYMCNAVLPSVPEVEKGEAADQFLPFVGQWSESSVRKNVRKELRAFFADYTLEMFAPLDYMREVRHHVYVVTRDVALVPPLIMLAASLVYRDRLWPGSSGIEIPTLVYADHSPGRIMRQRELNVRRTLGNLHEANFLTIESKANLDQVRFRSGMTWLDAVRAYYQERLNDED